MDKERWATVVVLISLLLPPGLTAHQMPAAGAAAAPEAGPAPFGAAGLEAPLDVTIYVDAGATGLNNGTSWADAYTDLQDALAAADAGDQVWVAEGTYRPTDTVSRTLSFQLETGVALYGGFPAGGGDGTFEARDFETYHSILSGDIGTQGEISDNSYHVVVGSGADATALLDGFTVTAGNASDTIHPNGSGGGMYALNGSPTVANCIFESNRALYGGGIYVQGSNSLLWNVALVNNQVTGFGGGVYNTSGSIKLFNAVFLNNYADYYGGGFFTDQGSPMVVNAILSGNTGGNAGGAFYTNSSNLSLTNVTISANRCTKLHSYGGGIYNAGSTTVRNAIIWGNSAWYSQYSQVYSSSGVLSIGYSAIQGGYSGTGNISADPQLVDPDGPDNVVGTWDDDLRLWPVSPAIDAGDNSAVPADAADLDDDGNTAEPVPLDLDWAARFEDQPGVPDTGHGTPPLVDMGAYERGRACWARLNDDPTDYATVQAAVDASTDPADVVKVAGICVGVNARAGLTQTVYLSKTLTVQGGYTQTFAGPPDPTVYPTVLDAGGAGRVLYITGQDIQPTVLGLRLTGGNAAGLGGWGEFGDRDGGGGGYIVTATATISDCWVYGNTAEAGAGLAIGLSDGQVLASRIYSNTATGVGGGGLALALGAPTLSGNEIYDNLSTGGHGGGLWAMQSSLSLLDNELVGNTTDEAGGGLYLWDCNGAAVRGNTIEDNEADFEGGGVALDGGSGLTVEANVIGGNTAGGNGGGLTAPDSEYLTVISNTVSANTSGDHGGGLALRGFYSLTLAHNVVDGNSSSQEGGGVSICCGDRLLVNDNTLYGNESGQGGGGLAVSDALTVTLRDIQAYSNTAGQEGGGLWLRDSHVVHIEANTLATNTAGTDTQGNGGGLFLGNCLTVTISANELFSNTAIYDSGEDNGGDGGGLCLDGVRGQVVDNTLWRNTAGLGGGGAALFGGTLEVQDNTVEDNQAAEDGGGLLLYEVDGSRLATNTLRGNTAAVGGGLVLYPHGTTTLSHNLVVSNSAEWIGGAFLTEGYVTLDGDRITGNVALEDTGGLLLEYCEADAANLVVTDNQADSGDADGVFVYSATVRLQHTTIARNGDGAGLTVGGVVTEVSSVALTNTILADHPVGLDVAGGNLVTMNGVLWGPTTPITATISPTATVTILNQLVGDPAFEPDGYHLSASSAAVDQGVDSGVAVDIDGDARPYGLGYDLGADEAIYGDAIVGLTAANDSPTPLGQVTTLTATVAAGTNVSYTWNLGDGTPGTIKHGAVVTHVYPAVGVFTAVVTASNNVNVATAFTLVAITDAPITGLVAVNDSPTPLGQPTHLTATVTGGSNITFQWDYGDGGPAGSGPFVSHIYGQVGIYTATVSASNGTNLVSATTRVTISDAPIAGLVASNDSPTGLGHATRLTATITAGTSVSYTWDFGDGSPPLTAGETFPHGVVVLHTYPATGTYTAVVTAANSVSLETDTTQVEIWLQVCRVRLNDDPTPYDSVQEAVDASTDPADVVKVSGTCYGVHYVAPAGFQQVYLAKTLTIRGGYSPNFSTWDPATYPTTLDAQGLGRVVYLPHSGTAAPYTPTLEALHLTNGYNWAYGGGIASHDHAHVIISGCHVYSNTAEHYGGGLYLSGATVVNSQIYSNTANNYHGGGLYLNGAHGAQLVGNEIHHNTNKGSQGAGIYMRYSTGALLAGNQIHHNQFGTWPGDGGGLYLAQNTGATLVGNTFFDNAPYSTGGAIYLYQNSGTVVDSNIAYGHATGAGGAVYLHTEQGALLVGNRFYDNESGGVVMHGSSGITLTSNLIYSNTGGGISISDSPSVTVSYNEVHHNSGGIGAGRCDYLTLNQNLVHHNSVDLHLGGHASGVNLFECNHATVSGNTIWQNSARGGVGGLRAGGLQDLTLVNNMVVDNHLTGSGLTGGIELASCQARLIHNTVAGNDSYGLYVFSDASVVMTNTVVAGSYVGVMAGHNSTVTLEATLWGDGEWANSYDWQLNGGTIVTGAIELWGDPAFVDPEFDNFHLLPASPAVNAGLDVGVAVDIDGDPRPYGGGFDIGADEVTPDDPVIGLTAFNNSPMELRDVTVLSATVSGGENVVFDWDLGDGQRAHGATIGHVYPAVGSYTAVVTASNSNNHLVATTRVTITHNAPIAGLSLTAASPTPLHQATHFTASVTAGSNVVYAWDFGDGSPPAADAGPTVDHTYPALGDYTAVVTASNSLGVTTATTAVQVVRSCWARLNDDATDYQTVQAAIDASSQASDVVKVAGLCVDADAEDNQPQVNLGKALTLRGGYSPDFATWNPALYPTTLDANGERYVVLVWGSYTPTLEALRVTNGAQGGIDLEGSHAVIQDCKIDHNGTGQWASGGIFANGASGAVLTGNRIHHNRSVGNGGGVQVNDSPDIRLTGNQIYANTAEADEWSGGSRGGGVSLENAPRAQVVDNAIHDNIAGNYGWGGGIIVYRGDWNPSDDVVLEGNRIYGNTGYAGGGIYFFGHRGILRGNWIYQNVTTLGGMGGGARLAGDDVLLVNNMIVENRTSGYAAGIEINAGTVRMLHNTVARNRMTVEPSVWQAEGVYLASGSVWMTNTIVVSQPMGVYVSPGNTAIAEATLWGAGDWANGTDFWGPLVTGTINLWADPAFVDPASLNYHIRTTSAARDAGIDAGVTTDIDDQPRPEGPGFDIGADECLPDVPIAGLTAANDSPTLLGAPTHLTATVGAGTSVSYGWTLGDGTAASGATVTHLYLAPGVYTATVTASNNASLVTDTTRVVVNDVPISGLWATNDGPTALGQPTGLSAGVAAGSSVVYAWQFGDGASGSGAQAIHTYAAAGVYLATVTATNSAGQAVATTEVTVYETVVGNPGGSQSTSDGVLNLVWSPQMTGTMTLTYTPQLSSSNLTGEFVLAGIVFHLEAVDENGNPITDLTTPITLTVHYNEAALPPGLDEADLELLRYDTTLGWVRPPQTLDTAANSLTVVLDHLSEFALVAPAETGSVIYLPVVLRR